MRLTGTNTYNGTTIVTGGRLIIDGRNQGTGLMTIKENGCLSGTGTIAGPVVVNGSMQADLSSTGSCQPLTINGILKANDATLIINMEEVVSGLADDTEIKILNLTSAITGTGFTEISPATPSANQIWDTSRLASDGIIKVVAKPSGINNATADGDSDNKQKYDLTGKPVNNPKGIFIQNGKKHISK